MKHRTHFGIALVSLAVLFSQCQQITSEAGRTKMESQPTNNSANQDPLNLPVDGKISGNYMKAFLTAYDAFKADSLIPEDKKRIENYRIEFRQHGDVYFILFFAKRKPNERGLEGGESELGKDVMYSIRKTDYQIIKRLFFK